jgi:two-component system NtrC family sensor kinase
MKTANDICTPGICRLCSELATGYDLEQTLEAVARNIARSAGVKACSIRLLDRKHMTLEIVAAYGLSKAYLDKGPVPLDQHPVDERILAGEAVATEDITSDPHLLYVDEARKEGIASVLSVPLTVQNQAIGVVRIFTDSPHIFTPEEIELVRALASLGGILIDRTRLEQRLRALIQVSRSITSTLSLQEVLNKVVENAAEVLGFKAASIRLLDEERRLLVIKATYGLSRAYLEKGPVEVERSPMDRQCLAGEIVAVPDISKGGLLQYPEEIAREGIGALLSLPLEVKGAAIGVLRVYNSRAYEFSDFEKEFLTALASQGATAIENARLFEHIHKEYQELSRDVWKWYDWGKRFPEI